jgi:hypothetical protein
MRFKMRVADLKREIQFNIVGTAVFNYFGNTILLIAHRIKGL